jgi:hypothetical protein
VCVDGFIPPRAFQDFQAHRILPIAADIRTRKHLTYTPAPDIIHEAAGHAPFLRDASYAEYLMRIGAIGRRAFSTPEDDAIYQAIFTLSEVKENPASTPDQVARAERMLERAIAAQGEPSEAALLARLYWWTVEYGLVGQLDRPKLYGAGLLSSMQAAADRALHRRRLRHHAAAAPAVRGARLRAIERGARARGGRVEPAARRPPRLERGHAQRRARDDRARFRVMSLEGEQVVSVYAGDSERRSMPSRPPSMRVPKPRTRDAAELEMLHMFERSREAFGSLAGSRALAAVEQISARLDADYPDEWLLRYELLAGLARVSEREPRRIKLARKLIADLEQLEILYAHREPIATGLSYLRGLLGPSVSLRSSNPPPPEDT